MSKYDSCYAAFMQDGRSFTDYSPQCRVDDKLCAQNNISNSYQYRVFLQQNAEKMMDENRSNAIAGSYCWDCHSPQVKWTNMKPLRKGNSPYNYS